jgi:hypothetical protein
VSPPFRRVFYCPSFNRRPTDEQPTNNRTTSIANSQSETGFPVKISGKAAMEQSFIAQKTQGKAIKNLNAKNSA